MSKADKSLKGLLLTKFRKIYASKLPIVMAYITLDNIIINDSTQI